MLKRFELHNHTTESDAHISCAELLNIMLRENVDAFALTDHNTISGHRIMQKLIAESNAPVRCIYGMEYTTYYGHILCLNLHQYVPWDRIDRRHPELLFAACKQSGALTGVAHPFSYGDPFARGCRFEMTIHDFSNVDYIEIFNNANPLHEVNAKSLAWWESLVLQGEHLAATAGMDLHGDRDMSNTFATYAEGSPDGDPAQELTQAIQTQRTWVSKGMAVEWQTTSYGMAFTLTDLHKPGFTPKPPYLLTLTSPQGTQTHSISETEPLRLPIESLPGKILIPKLYTQNTALENLLCIAPVLRL